MKKIIGILRPFDYKQQFFVYEDGNKIDSIETTIDDLPKEVIDLAQKYEIIQVDLTGPKQYGRGIKKNIEELEATQLAKFKKVTSENTKLEIRII